MLSTPWMKPQQQAQMPDGRATVASAASLLAWCRTLPRGYSIASVPHQISSHQQPSLTKPYRPRSPSMQPCTSIEPIPTLARPIKNCCYHHLSMQPCTSIEPIPK
ncbi:hypothetical protein HYPSUDRAFT_45356 [Hypholoma sublateritium FD-334 SS-4]|uniref:Uncharacterized protein n=1 Tax=Hypholoma sublateritium (strain FD-334 SS-4) TaxID=945553 RepID=A0A0D2M577_HYPSF|nr:hypothetical protein HYPSUDRAFT_45356 [Hypholoma sublateritium FD-334 SS-4]